MNPQNNYPTTPDPTPPDTAPSEPPATSQQPVVGQPIMPAAPVPSAPVDPSYPAYDTDPRPSYVSPDYAAYETAPRKKRRVLGFVLATAVILLLGAGYVFAYYLPNQPESIWNTGLGRTGTAIDTFVTDATEPKKLEAFSSTQLTGEFVASGPDFSYSGALGSMYNPTASDSSLNFQKQGTAGYKLDIQLLSERLDGNTYPDTYFRVTGLAALGLDAFIPGVNEFDGKWVSVLGSTIETYVPAEEKAKQSKDSFGYADAAQLTRILTAQSKEYVFTSDESKSILVRKDFVGTETLEGDITTNHYTATLSKANVKTFCKGAIEALTAADAYKKLPWVNTDTLDQDTKSNVEDCQKQADEKIDESETFDVWIDKKYKLVHKVRFSDKEDKGDYLEIGQTYTDGDTLPLFIKVHSDKDKVDGKMTLQVNTKTNQTKGSLSFTSKGDFELELTASFEFKPYAGEIKIQKPDGAIPLEELLDRIGLAAPASGAPGSFPSVKGKANDTERITDIKALQGQLEASYARNGQYPSLAQLNNPTWRAANMKGLDDEALQDPEGASKTLAPVATSGRYGYSPRGCVDDGTRCTGYTLTAMRSTGELEELESLL